MTHRQAQTLRTLAKLYAAHPSGVHYTALAEEAGVGKWGAYDMLITLEGLNLVARRYEEPRESRAGGRPRVLFAPTPHAMELLDENGLEAAHERNGEDDWWTVRNDLLSQIENLSDEQMEALDAEFAGARSPLTRCGYLVASLVAIARDHLGHAATHAALQRLLESPMPLKTKLTAICGTLAAAIGSVTTERQLAKAAEDILSRLETCSSRLRAPQAAALIEFLVVALRRLAVPPA